MAMAAAHPGGMRNLHRRLTFAGLLIGLVAAAGCYAGTSGYTTTGRVGVTAYVEEPPPPRQIYYDERPGYVYVHGRWIHDGYRWRWVDGRYVRQRPGQVYRQGYWDTRGGRHVWVDGSWERQRPGHVYARGYWDTRGGRQVWVPGRWQRDRGDAYVWMEGRWVVRDGRRVWQPGRWVQRDQVRDHRRDEERRRIYTSPRRR
jgi:hypothetical protein